MCQGDLARPEQIIETKVTDRLDHSGEHKPEGKNQRDAIMRAAEPHQGVRRVTEAKEGSTHFQIKIGGGSADHMGKPGIKDRAKHERQKQAVAEYRQLASVLAEKPRDCCPIPQDIPQLPGKPDNTRDCTSMPFSGTRSRLVTYSK